MQVYALTSKVFVGTTPKTKDDIQTLLSVYNIDIFVNLSGNSCFYEELLNESMSENVNFTFLCEAQNINKKHHTSCRNIFTLIEMLSYRLNINNKIFVYGNECDTCQGLIAALSIAGCILIHSDHFIPFNNNEKHKNDTNDTSKETFLELVSSLKLSIIDEHLKTIHKHIIHILG